MPRSSNRGLGLPQRQSPRLRKPCSSDSEQPLLHHRSTTERIPRLICDRRSPRIGGSLSDPSNQKKLGTRIADLESQLGQAQDELRVLKDQLTSAEAAKKQAQAELNMKNQKSVPPDPAEALLSVKAKEKDENVSRDEVPGDAQQETDVFEVPVEKLTVANNPEVPKVAAATQIINLEAKEPKGTNFPTNSSDDLGGKEEEITVLKAKLYDMEKEREMLCKEKEWLKNRLTDSTSGMSNAKAKEEEIASKMNQMGRELEESKTYVSLLEGKLEAIEEEKEALETEMRKLRVQTEQWRKAADAAAAVLAGGFEIKGRVSERCGATEKHLVGEYIDPVVGLVGSPGTAEDSDDGFGSGKRKSSGIKRFGDLWRNKTFGFQG